MDEEEARLYNAAVDRWRRGLTHPHLVGMVTDYKHGIRTEVEEDAVREYVRRNPSKAHLFPELFGPQQAPRDSRSKRLSHPMMSDDIILV